MNTGKGIYWFYLMMILVIPGFVFAGVHGISGETGISLSQEKQKKHKEKKEKDEIRVANPSLLIDAKKEALTGNEKSAIDKFNNIIDKYPDDPVAYYELSRIYTSQNKAPEALENARKAYLLNPDNEWYAIFLAELCFSTSNNDEAIELYKKLSEKKPGNTDFLYQLSTLYLQEEKYKEVIDIYNKIEDKAGISEEISLQKEKIYLHLKDEKSAEKEIQKLIDAFPREPKYYSVMAEFYLSNEMPEKALAMYKKVAEIDPDNAYIHMSLADFYRKAGDNAKAYEELKAGFATPNLDVDTKVNILLSFYTVNQIYNDLKEQAFTLSKILINTHPGDPKVYSIYGDFLLQDKQYPEAREAFLKVLTLDSSRYVVWEQILRLDMQLNEYEHLILYGKRAIELFPEQPLPFLFTGLGLMQIKKYDEALKILKTGENLVVDNSEIQSQFCMYEGDILHALKKDEAAFQAYEKSLALQYNNAYVLNNYAYYLSLLGKDLDKAEKMSKKAVELDSANASFQDTYGWVLFKKGKFREASEWILKAINNKEEPNGEVLEHYGDALFNLHETEKALEYWNKAKIKGGGSELLEKKINDKKYYPAP